MNTEQIFEELKKGLANDVFSEGTFKVIVDEKVILETPAILTTSGSIIPQDWDVIEEAMYGFDAVENCKHIFEDIKGQHYCFFGDENSLVNVVIPGVQLSKELEYMFTETLEEDGDDDELASMGVTQDSWAEYLAARPKTKSINNKI